MGLKNVGNSTKIIIMSELAWENRYVSGKLVNNNNNNIIIIPGKKGM